MSKARTAVPAGAERGGPASGDERAAAGALRAAAAEGVLEDAAGLVAALQMERVGYVQRGLSDRVGQVDEQLRLFGAPVDADR